MKYPFKHLKVKSNEPFNLENLTEELKRRKRGEILHLTLSLVKTWEDFEKISLLVKKAFFISGEKPFNWNLEKDFINPLKALVNLPNLRILFPSSKEKLESLFRERDLLFKGLIFRPDRIILYPYKVIVVDFKTHQLEGQSNLLENYQRQVKNYTEAVFQIFQRPAQGFLLFIEEPKLEEVCFLC
ncbi:MAG: hypothetical protein NZ530_07750 [Thermodesulfobacteriaceae bacterium]|nr:hypothetical protein [Thermodesulfobacteriaceae bacterium]MCX8041307.1 hypothetical protein [Thermodesulfobacteriaceae bacterium]MDW8136729.1 hypothetical protein [Thermodesulfobacterium sp.]